MSIDAIEYGVQAEKEVRTWFRVRCDDRPSGFVMVSKTPPTGANAMTVTIKPLYGEPFTINADLLERAMHLALHTRVEDFDKAVHAEVWRRQKVAGIEPNDRVEVVLRGDRSNRRKATVIERENDYEVKVRLDRVSDEEQERHLIREVPNRDVVQVFDRDAIELESEK